MSSLEDINKAVANLPWKKIGNGTVETLENIPWKKVGIATAVGITSVYVGAPLVVSGLGFKATGIASSSIAAKMMSTAAIANGGGVSATSAVAALQSAGVLGISAKTGLIIGGATGGATLLAGSASRSEETKHTDDIQDTNSKEVNTDALDCSRKSFVNGAKDIISDSASSTYSVIKTTSNMTYDLMNRGGKTLMNGFTSKPTETNVIDDACGKSDPNSSRYQSVVDGASGAITGITSYVSKVAEMPSSIWFGKASSDVKKED